MIFRLFKESKVKIHSHTKIITDTGYQGLKKLLTKEDKHNNQYLARERSINENVIGLLKRFNILSDLIEIGGNVSV